MEPVQALDKGKFEEDAESSFPKYFRHFSSSEDEIPLFPLPEVSENDRIDVYLIHRGIDTKVDVITPLAFVLKEFGVTIFFDDDPESMVPGKGNKTQMKKNLAACRVGAVLFSRNFLGSVDCVKEANTVLKRQYEDWNLPIEVVPFFYEESLFEHPDFRMFKSTTSPIRRAESASQFALVMAKAIFLHLSDMSALDGEPPSNEELQEALQRYLEPRDPNTPWHLRTRSAAQKKRILIILAAVVVVTAIVVPFSTIFSRGAPINTPVSTPRSTPSPQAIPTQAPLTREEVTVDFIRNITLSGFPLRYPTPLRARPEELALDWLVDDDASTSQEYSLRRLRQRYGLVTLWFHSGQTFSSSFETTWATSKNECEWEEVKCDAKGTVTELDLFREDVSGRIPPDLGLLTDLKEVKLSRNFLSGSIPSSIGLLTSLVELYLDRNRLTGTIPSSFGGLVSLTRLELDDNLLVGRIPHEFKNLGKLGRMDLSKNMLTGDIPGSLLGEMTSLTSLSLSSTSLSSLESIGNAKSLRFLSLSRNTFTGSIPPSLAELTDLYSLSLRGSKLTGSIPSSFENLLNLEDLDLSFNFLTGPLPSNFASLTKLKYLDLASNLLEQVPSEIGNLTNLEALYLSDNPMVAPIPTWLGRLTAMRWLELQNSGLTGTIPSQIGLMVSLEELVVRNNTLSGSIPSNIGRLQQLYELDLSNNTLSGSIPTELGALNNETIHFLALQSNSLVGSVPSQLVRLGDRSFNIDLYNNDLTGSIPFCLLESSDLPDVTADCNKVVCTCCIKCCPADGWNSIRGVGEECDAQS